MMTPHDPAPLAEPDSVTPLRRAEDFNEFELHLLHFLAEAYAEIDPRKSIGNSILCAYLGECLEWATRYRRWRDEPVYWRSDPDLEAEYLSALCETSDRALRPLRYAGVTERALTLAVPAFARVQPRAPNLFDIDPDSNIGAFILPVRVAYPETPETVDPETTLTDGAIVDLVAFTPGLAQRWALRRGIAEWLGTCPAQYMEADAVRLYRTPLDWLRADCEGLVCLATEELGIYRFLTRFGAVAVEDAAHADELRTILSRPLLGPEIITGSLRHGR